MEDATQVVGPGVVARGTALPVIPGAGLLTMGRLDMAKINLRIASYVLGYITSIIIMEVNIIWNEFQKMQAVIVKTTTVILPVMVLEALTVIYHHQQ